MLFISNLLNDSILGYIDPGTGSIILQAIIAGVIGISVTVKLYWHRILKFFNKSKTTEVDDLDKSGQDELR